MRGVRSFLGHARVYRRFIRDFSKIAKPLCNLLMKEAPFNFSNDYLLALELLKEKLITATIIVASDWSPPFEVMYDTTRSCTGTEAEQDPSSSVLHEHDVK